MLDVLWWFLGTTLIGWLCFPLTARLFLNLPSRGFALTRAVGLLIWGYFFWIFTSLGVVQNNLVGQSLILGLLVFGSILIGIYSGYRDIWRWLVINWREILGVELVFLVSFSAFALFRAASPAIVGTEKPMELAFLNGILRSEGFPPHDPWLSGHSISYYYFGYLIVAMVTRLTGTISTTAFNLAQALWFAFAALSAYGLMMDFFAIKGGHSRGDSIKISSRTLRIAVLAPVLLLLLGNAFGFFDVLHARGVFWGEENDRGRTSVFWDWVDLHGLDQPPAATNNWVPQRSETVPWWHASRVIQDYTYTGESVEVIDEFPNFSFVLGDLHPHVLAIPFVLTAIALGLNDFIAPQNEKTSRAKGKLFHHGGRFLVVSGLIGSLAFLNTWDWPIYTGLYSGVFLIRRCQRKGWGVVRLIEFIMHGLGMAVLGYLFYLPFFRHFSSQAAGILPSLIYFTRGIHFWVMFGPLLCLVGLYLVFVFQRGGASEALGKAALWVGGLILLLIVVNIIIAVVAVRLEGWGDLFMANQGAAGVSLGKLLWAALVRRLTEPGTWLTLSGLLILCISVILVFAKQEPFQVNHLHVFVLLLILWGGLLALLPEYVYLLDNFGKRMNTIFKFYFQTWILWSLGAAFFFGEAWDWMSSSQYRFTPGLFWAFTALSISVPLFTSFAPWMGEGVSHQLVDAHLVLDLLWISWGLVLIANVVSLVISRQWAGMVRILSVFCLSLGLFYPILAIPQRANGFSNPETWTLDGGQYYRQHNPDLMDAVDWLWAVQAGVLAEAVGPGGGDYTGYARVSMLSGLPAVLGWEFHEIQWRGGVDEIGTRKEDLAFLYETHQWQAAQGIIDKYNIEYIYIGDLERRTYNLQEAKFEDHLDIAFQKGSVTIYSTNLD